VTTRDQAALGIGLAAGGVVLLAGHVLLGIVVGPGYAIPTTIVGAIMAAVILRGPVGVALAKRIQGGGPAELPPEQLLTELDDLRGRIAELEERADFSERLLSQHRERESSSK